MKKVSKDERKKLLALFKLYDLLKISSYELGAIDNPSLEIFAPTMGSVERTRSKPLGRLPGRDLLATVPLVSPVLAPSTPVAEKEAKPIEKSLEEIKPPLVRPKEIKKEEKKPAFLPPERKVSPKKARPKEAKPIDLRKEVLRKEEMIVPSPKPSVFTFDNLKILTVDRFRKISSDPKKAAEILKEKIRKLVSVSPQDKVRARESFKASELYKLYIQMGRESMEQGKTISQISELRRVNKKPYLAEDEFEAVADISKMI